MCERKDIPAFLSIANFKRCAEYLMFTYYSNKSFISNFSEEKEGWEKEILDVRKGFDIVFRDEDTV